MLLGSLALRVAEGIANGEGYAIDGHLDIVVAGEVLTTAGALDIDVSALIQSHQTRHAQGELILQQTLRQAGSEEVESATPSLQGIALG